MQKAKKEKKFAEDLKKGDRVVTKSGLHGKVFDFSEKNNAIIIETGSGKLTYDKSAISLEMSQKLNQPTDKK
jgi:preprotein translocase subunit YajC